MACKFIILIGAILFASNVFAAADAFTIYENLYNTAKAPAQWTADFSANAYTHCEMAANSNKTLVQSLIMGVCSFNDGTKTYQAPCYLSGSANVAYGFSLADSPGVNGYALQLTATDLVVSNQRGVVVADYRRNNTVLVFRIGTSDIGYGTCSK